MLIFWSCKCILFFALINPEQREKKATREGIKVNDSLTTVPSVRHYHFITYPRQQPMLFSFWLHFHSNYWFVACKGPITPVQLPLNGALSVAVVSCLCVHFLCLRDEDKDNTVSTVLRDNNHWNRMSFSREMQIFIYMTDCIAVPVIVTVTTSPCSCSPS